MFKIDLSLCVQACPANSVLFVLRPVSAHSISLTVCWLVYHQGMWITRLLDDMKRNWIEIISKESEKGEGVRHQVD